MTGRYSWRSPLKRGVLMGHAPSIIEPDRPTLASVLHQGGYQTAAIGKWHLGLGWKHNDGTVWDAFNGIDPLEYELGDPLAPHRGEHLDSGANMDYASPYSSGPTALGFDRFFGIAGSLNMPPYAFLENDRTVGIPVTEKSHFLPGQRPGLEAQGWDEHDVDLRFTAEAVNFIAEVDPTRPFLLYFAPSAPHRPQVPPSFLQGSSDAGPRGDSVAFVDWMVGELVSAARTAGVLEDTIFIFTSDNGAPTIFPDDGDTIVHRANGPWRGQKGDVWDGGHREPLVIRWPGHIPAGTVSDHPMGLIDLLPTLAAVTGIPLPNNASPDGIDRSAQLEGGAAPASHVRVYHSMGGAFSINDGRWKAIFDTGSGGGLSEPKGHLVDAEHPRGQLYDLISDPAEERNLWDQQPEVVVRLRETLDSIVDPTNLSLPSTSTFKEPQPTNQHLQRRGLTP
jgi:arylsulfatase A-like enzyme